MSSLNLSNFSQLTEFSRTLWVSHVHEVEFNQTIPTFLLAEFIASLLVVILRHFGYIKTNYNRLNVIYWLISLISRTIASVNPVFQMLKPQHRATVNTKIFFKEFLSSQEQTDTL